MLTVYVMLSCDLDVRRTLTWGDAGFHNTMHNASSGQFALIDFPLAGAGSPFGELGYFFFLSFLQDWLVEE